MLSQIGRPSLVPDGLRIHDSAIIAEVFAISTRSVAATVAIPRCGAPSRSVYSGYWLRLSVLAAHGRGVCLTTDTWRFRCVKETGALKRFAERLDPFIPAHAGEPKTLRGSRRCRRVHPRARGGARR